MKHGKDSATIPCAWYIRVNKASNGAQRTAPSLKRHYKMDHSPPIIF
jgi:hypothetical protein